jgi:hypothetical protein
MAYEDELREAVRLIKAGERDAGGKILQSVLQRDINNERAWLWMSACVTLTEEKRECLERVIHINPNNDQAIKALAKLPPPPTAPAPDAYQPPAYGAANPTYQPDSYQTGGFQAEESSPSASLWGAFQPDAQAETNSLYGGQNNDQDNGNFPWANPSQETPMFSSESISQEWSARPVPSETPYRTSEVPLAPVSAVTESAPATSINTFSAAADSAAWKKRAYQEPVPWYR